MHVLCPHCGNAIELVKVSPRDEIVCGSCGSSFHLEGSSTTGYTETPESLGRFSLQGVVGSGAFGVVYKAREPQLDRTVAIKVPRRGNVGESPRDLERFIREARSVAQLRHPAIVAVHEVSSINDTPYLVSDFVDGVARCRPGTRDWQISLRHLSNSPALGRCAAGGGSAYEGNEVRSPKARRSRSLSASKCLGQGLQRRDTGDARL